MSAESKATHRIRWADGGIVGYTCSQAASRDDDGILSSERDDGEGTCPYCGQRLRLVWDVRIDDVEPEGDPQKQAEKAEVSIVEEEAQAVIANLRADLGERQEVLKRTVRVLRDLHRTHGHPGIDHRVSGIVASLADDIERALMDKGA